MNNLKITQFKKTNCNTFSIFTEEMYYEPVLEWINENASNAIIDITNISFDRKKVFMITFEPKDAILFKMVWSNYIK